MSEELKIAENINTPAERLRELSKTKEREILAAIAKNPNTPPDLLVELAGEYLDEIGFNPALDLILFENPNFIHEIFFKHFSDDHNGGKVYSGTKLPNWFLKLGLNHPYPLIRDCIAQNTDTPANYLEKLAKDEDREVRLEVARNENTPIHILEKLAEDENDEVRSWVAYNKNNSVCALEKLAQDKSAGVRYQVANNPHTNSKIIKLLFEDRSYSINNKTIEEMEEAIELELKRLDWTEEKARKWIEERIAQIGDNLSNEKFFEFWQYLTSIESNTYPTSLRKYSFSTIIFEFIIPF